MMLMGVATAFATPGPVAYFSFDDGLDGVSNTGAPIRAHAVGFPGRVPGRHGMALKAGPLAGQIKVDSAGIISPEEGTVEMWVMPVDWTPDDGKFHVFFETRASGALYLYKYFEDSKLLMLATDNADDGPFASSGTRISWKPGQWHHIAGTWSADGGVLLFVDGKSAGSIPVPASLSGMIGATFTLGDSPWHSIRISSSLIDDVRIYDRALGAAEIQRHYQGTFQPVATITREHTTLNYAIADGRTVLTAHLTTDPLSIQEDASVLFSLTKPDGQRQTVISKAIPFPGRAEATLSIAGLPPGKYQLNAEVDVGKGRQFSKSTEVTIPATDWLPRQVDRLSPTLAPWTNPVYNDGEFRVWGRRYTFGTAALPTQIQTAGKNMLASPMSLQVMAAGMPIELTPGAHVVNHANGGRTVEMNTVVKGETPLGVAISFDVTARIEPDGLVWITIDSDDQSALALIDDLVIEIPMLSDRTLYRHRWSGVVSDIDRRLPDHMGTLESSRFRPFYWLGDNDAGVFWVSESPRSWPNAESRDALSVVRSRGQVSLIQKIKVRGQKLPVHWKYEFGIQATPVKPLRRGWRGWRLAPAVKPRFSVLWPTRESDSFKYYGYPEPANDEIFAKRLASMRERGIEPMPYICPTCISTASPEWKFFSKTWSTGIYDSTSSDVLNMGAPLAMVSPRAPGWSGFMSSRIGNLVRRYGLTGIYLDNVQPYGSFAPSAGIGYVENNRRIREYPISAYRELMRNIRIQLDTGDTEVVAIAHMSGKMAIPMLSFVDAYLDGEQFRGVVRDNYLDVMTLDDFRAEFMGRQWGLAPIFLPEFSAEVAQMVRPTRGLMALLMLHDVGVWPLWCNVDEVNRALEALESFGYEDAVFHPYFSQPTPARTSLADVYVSSYERNGAILLVVGNLSTDSRHGKVCLNPSSFTGLHEAQEWPSRTDVALDSSGCMQVDLQGQDYRLIRLEPDGPGSPVH